MLYNNILHSSTATGKKFSICHTVKPAILQQEENQKLKVCFILQMKGLVLEENSLGRETQKHKTKQKTHKKTNKKAKTKNKKTKKNHTHILKSNELTRVKFPWQKDSAAAVLSISPSSQSCSL